MKKSSFGNQRISCNCLSAHKSELHNFQIDKKQFLSCKSAHIQYDHYLEQEKEAQDVSEEAKKRKIFHDEIVKKKKEDLIECIEANRDFTLLTKANSYGKTKMRKEKFIKALYVVLVKLENDVKALGE